jgi:hypothetical protein
MKKAFALLAILLSVSGYSQQKSIRITAEDISANKLTNSLKIVEEKTVNIPIYKDTLVKTKEYKDLVGWMNGYKQEYNVWLKEKKTNEEYNTDIAKIINNLETYMKSKENYEITKPLIDEAQNLILKNKIYYHDYYGRTNNELIILSLNGKKPQKSKSFLDGPDYETPIERCLSYCKSIKNLEEPYKGLSIERYLEYEKKIATAQQFETIRVPSNKTVTTKRLLLDDAAILQELELIGTFNISESKYAVLLESEDHANNEVIEVALLNPKATKTKNVGSEIFTNVVTGKKYLSENPELLSELETNRKEIAERQQTKQQLSKYGTVYYDKERESDMLKIQTGAMKLSSYNPQDIPEFVSIYNSLYGKLESNVKQIPAHIAVLKKYYTLYQVQRRNMSQANINAWITAVKSATPLRKSMGEIVMNDHYGDAGFYPNLKYEGTQEDFDLYYNAALSILGI